MEALAVIPARFASSRFPGKPLADIAGKSMIQRVVERARLASGLSNVVVATDDQRIFDHVKNFGEVVMTSSEHQSGTDRCAEVAEMFPEYDVLINVQGDEPFIHPKQIELLISSFVDTRVQIATLVNVITDTDDLFNQDIPKVTINSQGNALYFSRQPIPFFRGLAKEHWLPEHRYYKHVGIYGYRREALHQITKFPLSPLERAEALEQLRWLENGCAIRTVVSEYGSYGIDRPEDIAHALEHFKGLL